MTRSCVHSCCCCQSPATLETLQDRWDEVIVDEFQDINRLDFVLVEAIARKAVLVVTGDDDQAIYGFRGCTPEYIIDLEKHLHRPIESYELQINYRCPPLIVEHADRLIRHNAWRIPKNPRASGNTTAQIHLVASLSAGLEARSIVAWIQRVRSEAPDLSYSDFAVLYRTNAQSLPLQIEFIRHDIPYYVRKEDNILANEQLDRLLSILRLKLCWTLVFLPPHGTRLEPVCSYFRYVEPKTAARVEAHFRLGGEFLDAIRADEFLDLCPETGRATLQLAMHQLRAARDLAESLEVIAQWFRGLKGMLGGLDEVIEERMPLGEIREVAAGFGGGIREFVASFEAALERARTANAGHDHRTGVPLLTYFRAKGLQWHTVILTTCNEGLIPHQRAELEEERRLFYVAMTRASSNLVLSYVQCVCSCKVTPSRFLFEAGLLEKPAPRRKKKPSETSAPPAADIRSLSAVCAAYVSSLGSHVYHRPDCPRAKRIVDALRVEYATRAAAVQADKRPCGQCHP